MESMNASNLASEEGDKGTKKAKKRKNNDVTLTEEEELPIGTVISELLLH